MEWQSDGGFVVWDSAGGRVVLTRGEAAVVAREIQKTLFGSTHARAQQTNAQIKEMSESGMTGTSIARKLGVSQSYVSQVLVGRRGGAKRRYIHSWTPDRVQELRDLAERGLTRMEIAKALMVAYPGTSSVAAEGAIDRFKIPVRRDKPGPKPANAAG